MRYEKGERKSGEWIKKGGIFQIVEAAKVMELQVYQLLVWCKVSPVVVGVVICVGGGG